MANASGLCSCTALWSRSLFRASGSHLRQQTFNWSSSGSILLLGQHSTGPKVGKLSSWNLVNKLKQLLEKVMFFFKVSLLNHHALQGFCYCCCNNSLANSYPSRILQAIFLVPLISNRLRLQTKTVSGGTSLCPLYYGRLSLFPFHSEAHNTHSPNHLRTNVWMM